MTRAFALNFSFLVIVPLTILVTVFMTLSWKSYHDKAMEGVATLHLAIEELLQDEADSVSMMLSQLVHANNGAIMALASKCDTDDSTERYRAYSQLSEILEYSLKNDSDFIALTFNFDSGRHVSYDSEVGLSQDVWTRHDRAAVMENTVDLRAVSASNLNNAYQSVSVADGNMVWSALLVPGPLIDRIGNIASVELLYVSDVYQTISRHDTAYKLGSNSIGYSVLLDDSTSNVLSIGRMDEDLLADYLGGRLRFGWTYVSGPDRRCIILAALPPHTGTLDHADGRLRPLRQHTWRPPGLRHTLHPDKWRTGLRIKHLHALYDQHGFQVLQFRPGRDDGCCNHVHDRPDLPCAERPDPQGLAQGG